MKKTLLFMAAAMGLGLSAHAADGDRFTVDDVEYYVISEEEHTVAVYDGSKVEGDYVMPSTVANGETTYTITNIGGTFGANYTFASGYYGCKATSITVSNTVVEIGNNAFRVCQNLVSVEIPTNVKTIGSAFGVCPMLESVSLPEGLTTLSANLFGGCPSLTKITIPSTVTEIAGTALSCENLDTIVALPKTAPKITGTFKTVPATAIVYVPKGTITKYPKAAGWDYFSDFRVEGVIDLALNEKELTLAVGETKTLMPTYTNITPGSEKWASSDAQVATVADGMVTAVAEGTATITLTVSDQYNLTHTMRCEVTVTSEAGIASIEAEAIPEYYNLGGLRVSEDALTPGIYIKRQGTKASKVIVK